MRNVQLYPSRTRIEPNDKLTKVVFSLMDEQYRRLVEEHRCQGVVEVRDNPKHGKILTPLHILNQQGYLNVEPLNQFDRAVLSVCISEWQEGNRYTTKAIIYRGLTGKVGDVNSYPSKDQEAAITNSMIKLMCTFVDFNNEAVNEKLGYNGGKPNLFRASSLLPAYFDNVTINGGSTINVVFFDRICPLLDTALSKGQLLSYDVSLLDVPNQRNTPLSIAVKNYVMLRIKEIQLHHLTPSITFADVFRKCRLENAGNDVRMNTRNVIGKFFGHLKACSEIKSFEVTKKGHAFHSITFTY